MKRGWVRIMMAGLISAAGLAACQDEQPVQVFMPPEGDAVRGRQVFIDFMCHSCHTIPDVTLPDVEVPESTVLALGVRAHRVRDYGDLITAVIYPDHVVSPKYLAAMKAAGRENDVVTMPKFTEKMTVAQLIDLSEFLHAQYSRLLSQHYRGKGSPPQGGVHRWYRDWPSDEPGARDEQEN